MKKLMALLLAFCLLLSMVPMAFAETTQFFLTEKVLTGLKEKGITYDYGGLNDKGTAEYFWVNYNGQYMNDIEMKVYVNNDYSRLSIYVFNIVTYDTANFISVMRACNQANYDYAYLKFYCDETDNTVTAEFDCYVTVGSAGEIAAEMIETTAWVADVVYNDYLSSYNAA